MKQTENMYKKGIDTRTRIINAAKEVFYVNGYYNSTIKMIKEKANVSLSAIPYYFKIKEQIIGKIYTDFLSEIYNFLRNVLKEKPDSYLMQFYASKIFYYIIFRDQNNSRFYYEVSVSQSNYQLLSPIINNIYLNYAKDFCIPISQKEMSLIRMADAGSRREILYNYYNKIIDISEEELINYVTSLVATLMGIDKSLSVKYGQLSTDFVNSIDFSHIKFLV